MDTLSLVSDFPDVYVADMTWFYVINSAIPFIVIKLKSTHFNLWNLDIIFYHVHNSMLNFTV